MSRYKRICEGCNENKTADLYRKGKILCLECEEDRIECEKICESCKIQKPLQLFRINGKCVECNKNVVEDIICEICDITLKKNSLKNHNLTATHKKRQKNKEIIKNILENDSKKYYSIPLKNKDNVIINHTLVDKGVYLHILENNYAVCMGDKGYAKMYANGKSYSLNCYIYYDFYGNERDELRPDVDHKNTIRLDNRIENLRLLSVSNNNRNRTKKKDASSTYYGVSKCKSGWVCRIRYNGGDIRFHYLDEIHAAYHYDLLIKKYNLQEVSPINDIDKPHDFILKTKVKKSKLPIGIRHRPGKRYYTYKYKGQEFSGKFKTIEEAVASRNKRVEEDKILKQRRIENKNNEPIKRNGCGIAILEVFDKDNKKVAETTVSDNIYQHLIHNRFHLNGKYVAGCINNKEWLLNRYIMVYQGFLLTSKDKVDHWDSNTLNNQTENLRILTSLGNAQNRNLTKNGVFYNEKRKKWESHIKVFGKRVHLKRWDTKEEAIQARDNYIMKLRETNPGEHYFKLSSEYTKK